MRSRCTFSRKKSRSTLRAKECALASYSTFTIHSPQIFCQATYLQVIRDNMSVLASWARNKNRSVVITLLANLVCRSHRAWLASKS